jgi:tartrate-resistant acid phosphatase type 5
VREFSHDYKHSLVGLDSRTMTRLLLVPGIRSTPRLASALACVLLVACSDDGAGGSTVTAATTGPASTGPGTSAPTTAGEPGTSGDTPTGGSGTGSASATTTTSPTTNGPTTTPQTSSTGDSATTPATGDPDTGDTAGTTDGDTTTGAAAGVVRFIAIGDTGEGNEDQYAVAQAIVELCAQKGCDFGMLLGDNFYDSGVSGVDDPQFQDKFELPYEDIEFPIYISLGNHDYGGNGIGVDFDTKKAQYQIDYTQQSQIWKLPAKYYSFKLEHAEFWGLDTNQVMTDPFNGDSDDQRDWLINGTAASGATWKIAFGHHPYLSNGEHGNAGNYENLEDIPLPFVAGESVKEFVEDAICGKIDVYLCGHDHTIQWLEPTCGTEFIVSGAGSKAGPLPGDNPAYFGAPETEGFMWVELKDNSFTGVFYDKTGNELFSKTITK